ncbi:MAG: sigma-70 family RNA polymerase sigma factor, partial [Actinobacteria bacterium]|nr:sigma-70 family RNA polymerase sigma factor [Actinomycetota bacterium]
MTIDGLEHGALGDAELLAAVRSGNQASFAQLYDRHASAALVVARQYTDSPQDAEDVVADSFAAVWSALRNGSGPQEAFRAYLFTVVRRVAAVRRDQGRRTEPTDDVATLEAGTVPMAGADDPTIEGFERSVVARAFRSLPERWRVVLWHSEVEGLSPAQIAPLLGLSANSTAALAYRAREGLRQAYLAEHLATPLDEGCRAVAGKLGGYVRGGLGPRETRQVADHVDGCLECTALVAELGDVNHGMRAVIAPLVLGVLAAATLAKGLPIGGGLAALPFGLGAGAGAGAASSGTGGAAASSGTGGAAAGGTGGAAGTGTAGTAGAGTVGATGAVGTAGAGAGTALGGGAAAGAAAVAGGAASGAAATVGGVLAALAALPAVAVAAVAVAVVAVAATVVVVAQAVGGGVPAADGPVPTSITSSSAEQDAPAPDMSPGQQPELEPTSAVLAPPATATALPTAAAPTSPAATEPATTLAEPQPEANPTPVATATPEPDPAEVVVDVPDGGLSLTAGLDDQTLTLGISNVGGQDATAVTAEVLLPTGVNLTGLLEGNLIASVGAAVPAASTSWVCVRGSGDVAARCTVGSLAAGARTELVLHVSVD